MTAQIITVVGMSGRLSSKMKEKIFVWKVQAGQTEKRCDTIVLHATCVRRSKKYCDHKKDKCMGVQKYENIIKKSPLEKIKRTLNCLEENCCNPPILYYSKYADMFEMRGALLSIVGKLGHSVTFDVFGHSLAYIYPIDERRMGKEIAKAKYCSRDYSNKWSTQMRWFVEELGKCYASISGKKNIGILIAIDVRGNYVNEEKIVKGYDKNPSWLR